MFSHASNQHHVSLQTVYATEHYHLLKYLYFSHASLISKNLFLIQAEFLLSFPDEEINCAGCDKRLENIVLAKC